MTVADDSARERVYKAVDALATSAASIHVRVTYAVLELAPLGPEDFSDPRQRVTLTAICERCSAVADADQGRVQATIETMSDEQAVAVADQIMSLGAHYLLVLDRD